MRHELPEPFTADVVGEYEVTVYFGSDFEASRRPFTWVDINQPAEFAIMFSQKEPFSRLSDIAFRLQHLLSLGTRRSAYPVTVQGHPGGRASSDQPETDEAVGGVPHGGDRVRR